MSRLMAPLYRLSLALRTAAVLLLLLASGWAQAVPSACGALWGTYTNQLRYFNPATNSWVQAGTAPVNGNALSGYEADGTLYFTSGTAPPLTMYKATQSNTAATLTVAQVSASNISIPANLTYTNNLGVQSTVTLAALVGATLDRDTSNRRMFLYATSGANAAGLPVNGTTTVGSAPVAAIGILDPEVPTSVSWSVVYQTTGTGTVTYPLIGGSGDIFADQQTGAIWIVTNSQPNRMLELSLNYTGFTLNSAQVVGTATIQVGGVGLTISQGAVGVEPRTGAVYIGNTVGSPTNTYVLTDHTASPVVATLVTNTQGVSDAGNCVAPPDPPTVAKSFSPTTATAPGTSQLSITIVNPNKVPIFTTANLVDSFPAGLVVSPTPSLSRTCFSSDGALSSQPASATITGTAGATSVTITSGALIPGGASGGSCVFTVNVSATTAATYNNTVPVGSLSTTVGANTNEAAASFTLQNLSLPNAPTIVKSFNPTTSTAATRGTTTLTIVITNPNTVTNTLTTALIDNLPTNMRIANPVSRAVNCFSDGVATTRSVLTTITGTINLGTATIPNGAVIPGGATAGSCSFSIVVSQTVAAFSLNTIPAGSLTMVSGTNPAEATAGYYLRASDFSVVKTQREGTTGVTTTAQLDVASGQTISYIIQIRNEGGVSGTRTFTDTLPVLITPTISFGTATVGGATGCRVTSAVVTGQTVLRGTVTAAPVGGGCDITVVAKASVTGVIGTATNSVGIYTPTAATDTDTTDNTATVVIVIKPAANLSITKDDGKTVLLTGSTNAYTITVANGGPASADGAVVKDPAATGLNCTSITCAEAGGASCPLPAQLFVSALQSGTGLAIPTFPSGGTVTFVLTCTVTATGEP